MKEKQRGDDHKLYCPTCKAGRNCMDHLMIRENDLQEQVTQLKADLATAKQGLEHYADEHLTWVYSSNTEQPHGHYCLMNKYVAADSPTGQHGYTVAQQTLDKIGKE